MPASLLPGERLIWRTFANGTRHLELLHDGKHVQFVAQTADMVALADTQEDQQMSLQGVIEMPDDLDGVYQGQSPARVGETPAGMKRVGAKSEPLTREQWNARRDALRVELARLEQHAPACTTCLYLDAARTCLKHEAKPPADFLARGCDQWADDGVPF